MARALATGWGRVPIFLCLAALGCYEVLPTQPQYPLLEPGTPITFSGAEQSRSIYAIPVPSGTGKLRILISQFTGNADIYVRFGAPPEDGKLDCQSTSEYQLEECIFDAPAAGTWYVLVYGLTAYNDARLRADLFPQLGERTLGVAAPVTGLLGSRWDFEMFSLFVPEGLDSLAVDLNATGDPDLYLGFERYPRLNSYECASFTATGTERCVFEAPPSGRWIVRVDAFTDFSAGVLSATFYPGS